MPEVTLPNVPETAAPGGLSVLVVGDLARDEFRDAAAWLQEHAALRTAACVDQAVELLRSASLPPTLIVLAQTHPGQLTDGQVQRIRRLAPLTPLIGLLGSWCEGDLRPRTPCLGVTRDYWHHWVPRFAADGQRLTQGECPVWGLPATATEEERWLRRSRVDLVVGEGLVVVRADQYETALALMDVCRQGGYSAVWLREAVPTGGAVACLWDIAVPDSFVWGRARELSRQLRPAALVALVGFPRVDQCRRLLDCGVATVVSKPYVIDDLLWHLDRVVRLGSRRRPEGPAKK